MTKRKTEGGPTALDSLSEAIERLKSMPVAHWPRPSGNPQQRNATLLSLELALRHTQDGNRRRHPRLALGAHVAIEAPAAASETGSVAILDIGSAGALIDSRRCGELAGMEVQGRLSVPDPALGWLSGTVVARRGPLLHVAFDPELEAAQRRDLETLLAVLDQRDTRIGRKLSLFTALIAARCAKAGLHDDDLHVWNDHYVPVADNRFVSPASAALEPLLCGDFMRLVSRLPWPAVIMAVDRNGHVAVALGDQIMRRSWRGTFTTWPALLLAARFARSPSLALTVSPDGSGETFWLASGPLHLGGRRWGCVAVLTPLRAPECAAPSPAG